MLQPSQNNHALQQHLLPWLQENSAALPTIAHEVEFYLKSMERVLQDKVKEHNFQPVVDYIYQTKIAIHAVVMLETDIPALYDALSWLKDLIDFSLMQLEKGFHARDSVPDIVPVFPVTPGVDYYAVLRLFTQNPLFGKTMDHEVYLHLGYILSLLAESAQTR
ncbi:hypothetical protein COW46_01940 [Candidatus Gracilibacteria bacterium CG17_big_fil_post_rev_8_21_14_2_50_48_13]|nr:MAG: hypothetical protein COW46_01940 [Candidatus Gracilibacteria bacterium CG17_big_fil_post_rev_8_21_14_2_50_48_13]